MVDRRRLDLSGITPPLQPVGPGDPRSEEEARRQQKEMEEERKWWREPIERRLAARRRTALLLGLAVGLAVVVVFVSRLVYRRFQR
jgi:hypothetical protein